jgi:hypothetical protein
MTDWLNRALRIVDAGMSVGLAVLAIWAFADGAHVAAAFFAANAGLAARRFLADE